MEQKETPSTGGEEPREESPKEAAAPVGMPPDPGPLGELFGLQPQQATDDDLKSIIHRHVAWKLAHTSISKSYRVLFLYDSRPIVRSDADRIYRALVDTDRSQPLLLIVSSGGGDIAAAYFIAKLCRESTEGAFEVAVPRQAKSAATLICCGADKIHMGSLSELGPIDPQFGSVPALALKHSIEHIAQLATSYPAAQEVFSTYLTRSLNIQALGYYERVAASAAQYAERLLLSRAHATTKEGAADIAHKLVYTYKDHGFAIDSREAREIFGPEVVALDTPAYQASNDLYDALDFLEWIVGTYFERDFSFTGRAADGGWLRERAKS